MKRLEHSLEGYLTAVFNDIRFSYRCANEWTRDTKRSLHELVSRGERFLTIDLPAIRKHLDRCLDDEIYTVSGLYLCSRKSPAIAVPAFLADLYLQIFEKNGKLRSDADPCVVADLRQLLDGLGKLKHQCKERYINDEIETFITNEESLRLPTLNWGGDDLFERGSDSLDAVRPGWGDSLLRSDAEQRDLFGYRHDTQCSVDAGMLAVLERVCDITSSSLGDFNNEESLRPKHGTGRVSNQRKSQSKYDFANWPNKLDRIFPFDFYASFNFAYDRINDEGLSYSNVEEPSKLIAVPKTMSGPRLIGSEPNYHLFVQQLIRQQIERFVGRNRYFSSCITFGDQGPNRDLARTSSVDGRFATVDLKSASDLLSCWTVERALRANSTLLERIHASRTRMMSYTLRGVPGLLRLRKCFTQGSACTFPVQTLIYSQLAIASVILSECEKPTARNIERASKRVRVFGDDIIVPTKALRHLELILSYLQLKVNRTKTFSGLVFRESCGFDAFKGHNVTPTRIRRFDSRPSHEVRQSMIESANNLLKRGYWNLSNWLDSITGISMPIDLPHVTDSMASFCGTKVDHLKSRYNQRLHRQEYLCDYLVSKPSLSAYPSDHGIFDYFISSRGDSFLSYLDKTSRSSSGITVSTSSVMKRGWKSRW